MNDHNDHDNEQDNDDHDCYGIHTTADGYVDCDGNPI